MSAPPIAVQGLSKRFGAVDAVSDLTFTVSAGETVVLWGANGAGKTTILRCVLGVMPFAGTIRVCGFEVRAQGKAARERVGYVPQEIRLHEQQTVDDTVRFYAALRRVPSERAHRLVETWGLSVCVAQRVQHLSGGMKQRLALLLALLADPPILLLDEPTSNLDVQTRREFSAHLERLKGMGKTLLLCSHHAGEVWRLADRVIVLEHGRKVREGSPDALAPAIGGDGWLGIIVAADRHAEAMAVLTAQGFPVQTNGNARQLWVTMSAPCKTGPLVALEQARIPVLDFETGSLPPDR